MIYTPLHTHCCLGSLLDSCAKPQEIRKFCLEYGIKNYSITDHGTLYGVVELEKTFKNDIKLIRGCELYLCKQHSSIKKDNGKHSHLPILAKNKKGWQSLIKIVSYANKNFYRKPRLSLDELGQFVNDDFIAFSGHPGSDLSNTIFPNPYVYKMPESALYGEVNKNWKKDTIELLHKYIDIFGRDNFKIEIQLVDQQNIPAVKVLAECLRKISREENIPCVGTADSHYVRKEDAQLQRILLCSSLKTTLRKVYNKLDNEEEFGLSGFFKSNNYHIPTPDEMTLLYTPEEIEQTNLIGEMCEPYKVSRPPILPSFPCENEVEYLRKLCYESPKYKIEYRDRLEYELSVITKNNLSGYFLIVQDYVNWAKNQGVLVGIGRGSAGGSIVSYLTNIIEVDPIRYNLMFERFYNEGRNTPERTALPDIDVDFPKSFRPKVIEYLKQKYGADRISNIVTLQTLQGKSALKEVLRVHEACSQEEMNRITKNIPNEAEISDQLDIMKKERGFQSIILWTLENEPKDLKEWCYIEDDILQGDYAHYFDIAIKLEGVKKNEGKHASGIVLGDEPLENIIPMVHKKGEILAGLEMHDLEELGLPKLDILGLSTIDKVQTVMELVNAHKGNYCS